LPVKSSGWRGESSSSKTAAFETKTGLTSRAADKCGRSAALSGQRPQTAGSASGGFVCQFPRLPLTPTVGTPLAELAKKK